MIITLQPFPPPPPQRSLGERDGRGQTEVEARDRVPVEQAEDEGWRLKHIQPVQKREQGQKRKLLQQCSWYATPYLHLPDPLPPSLQATREGMMKIEAHNSEVYRPLRRNPSRQKTRDR